MAIKQISPIHLDEGHLVANGATVLGGQVVKLVANVTSGENELTPALYNDTMVPYGFCYKASVAEPANNLYIPFNQYKAPLNRQSVILTKGARVELWNDGTGPVFEADVVNVTSGTPLYISASNTLTATPATSNANEAGSIQVAIVEKAPASTDGVLTARIEL